MQDTVKSVIDRALEYPVYAFKGAALDKFKQYSQEERTQLAMKVAAVAAVVFVFTYFTPIPSLITVAIAAFYATIHDIHSKDSQYVDKKYFTEFCLSVGKKTSDQNKTTFSKMAAAIRNFAASGKNKEAVSIANEVKK